MIVELASRCGDILAVDVAEPIRANSEVVHNKVAPTSSSRKSAEKRDCCYPFAARRFSSSLINLRKLPGATVGHH